MYERIIVSGNIGKSEVLTSAAGNPYVRISVAVNRKTANAEKLTVWYSVLLYGGLAKEPEKVAARYGKGRVVLVEGRPQSAAFIRQDGTAGLENSIIATNFPELMDRPPA